MFDESRAEKNHAEAQRCAERPPLNAMDENILPPLTPLEHYVETEGKLAASTRWLILRVYEQEKDIPDKLRHGAFRDERGHLQLDMAILTGLTNGSLYCQAAAKIFKEPQLVTQSHGAVIAALTDYGIDVVQCVDGETSPVTEAELSASDSFNMSAHLAMMDALMLAHLRNVITVDRVIDAVSRHTTVDESERPMDSVDALLFWINKVCLLVRDDVERAQIQLKGASEGGMIPEMEDLYDEISDGQCLCTLVAWYRPREMEIEEICYNDQMSTAHCHYNLLLLQRFCLNCLPWNPFHFEIEDIFYLHDSLQMNVNVFLADLFEIFEPAPAVVAQPEPVTSPRRFVPVQGIPDLRAANSASRSPYPPRVKNPFSNVHVTSTPAGPTAASSRSISMMSQDSLLTNRTQDSWRVAPQCQPPEYWGANVTNFGRLVQPDDGSNGNLSATGCSPYARSNSLSTASIRLALEEKRRDHEKRKALMSTMTESERVEKGKAAFFALMSRDDPSNTAASESPNAKLIRELDRKLTDLAQQVSLMNIGPDQQRISRALSQPSVYQEVPPAPPQSARSGYGTLPHNAQAAQNYAQQYAHQQQQQQQQQDFYGYAQPQQGPYGQPQQLRSSLSNGMLNYLPGQMPSYGEYPTGLVQPPQMPGQPAYTQDIYSPHMSPYAQQSQQQPGYTMMHQSAHAATGFSLHQPVGAAPMVAPPASAFSSAYSQQPLDTHNNSPSYTLQPQPPQLGTPQLENQPPLGYESQDGGATFRLHSQDASSSRVDPPLEINRNLTNWGMTYQKGHTGRPQRRTWENQTFIKSEHDLVNQPDLVPTVPSEDDQAQRHSPCPIGAAPRRSRDSRESYDVTSASATEQVSGDRGRIHDPDHASNLSQPSPPRDPANHTNGTSPDSNRSAAPSGPAFVVSDDQAAEDFDKIAEQRRQAKRAALLAKTMKRKEEIENKVDQIEQRNAEKRMAELAKREMAEQRKLEKELQRQKILDDYKRRKMEKELGLESGSSSARGAYGRGHSQPPFIRTKSQMSESALGAEGNDKGRLPRARGQSTVEQRISVQSLQEPTHKLFARATPKSNRGLIINALQYSVFPGAVNDTTRMKTMNDLAASDAKHFLVLFRDYKCQYRGLYSWDQVSDTAVKISGQGPSKCTESIMKLMFKYDSGAKNFSQIPTKHLGATIDGFTIQDQFWQKPKIPHSGAASHRNN
ncbi:Patronin [Trichostrongylus colubriformis]|uniref:Patronin n=1 Tax=Trichostrongylus colubriformis TaxID=6319 RepID=A0AAN8IMH6_TRICO